MAKLELWDAFYIFPCMVIVILHRNRPKNGNKIYIG